MTPIKRVMVYWLADIRRLLLPPDAAFRCRAGLEITQLLPENSAKAVKPAYASLRHRATRANLAQAQRAPLMASGRASGYALRPHRSEASSPTLAPCVGGDASWRVASTVSGAISWARRRE